MYVEINDTRIGAIKGYSIKSICSSRHSETIWGNDLASSQKGNMKYVINLTRLRVENTAVDFYSLRNFTLKIVKPGEEVSFLNCEWTDMEENCNLEGIVLESFTCISLNRKKGK